MAKIVGRFIVYTADDEMPDCLRCDRCDTDYDCSKRCGAQCGWAGYQHTEPLYKESENNR